MLYEFPDTYADGSSLRYTVTKACKKYVDISRKFILTLSQEDATTRGTQSVMVSYRKGLPDITVPEQKYKASFYDDDNYNDRLLLSDIVQMKRFLLMLSGVLLMVTVITRKYGFYHIQMIITM